MTPYLDRFARSRLAGAEDATLGKLIELASDEEWCVRESVAKNPASPPSLLELLAVDAHWAVRCGVASNVSAPREALSRLAEDEDPSVRAAVVNNPTTPKEVLDGVSISPSEWARPLFGEGGADDGRGGEGSHSLDEPITLRNVSVSWRITPSSEIRPCLEIRLESSWPGFMDASTTCLYMDDSEFKRRVRSWIIGTAFRHIRILNSVSDSELGATFSAAVSETREFCAENDLRSPRDLVGNELVSKHADVVTTAAQNALDKHYPIHGDRRCSN